MKFTSFAISSLLSFSALARAGAMELERDLVDNPLFAITFINTVKDGAVTPNDILSTFDHADVANIEADGGAVYGSVEVKYFNVVDQDCYNGANEDGALCTCSTSDEVTSNGLPITPVFTTTNSGAPDGTVTTVVRDELAPLLDSDANSILVDKAYVAYCIRFSLVTDDNDPLVANSQDVLVYFTGTNDPNAEFDVNGEAEEDDNGNPTIDDFTVTARFCDAAFVEPLLEGEPVSICIDSNDDPAARIVAIKTWTWSHTVGAAVVTQQAITNSVASNALTTVDACTPASAGVKSKCSFTTTFGTAIYDSIGIGAAESVDGSGIVELLFNGEVRRARVLFLKDGDNFAASASLALQVAGPEEDGSCDCFFLNIFCWIFQCLLGFLFG